MGWFMLVVWFVCVLYIITRPIDEKDKSTWDWRGQYGNNPNYSRYLDCSSGLEGDSPWESKRENAEMARQCSSISECSGAFEWNATRD